MTEETQQMEVVPLLPCPFCGKEARYVPTDYIDGMGEPWPFAECDPCNVGAPVEFWNKRADKGQGEPVAWQIRTKTNRVDSNWTEWTQCSEMERALHSHEDGKFNRFGIMREIRPLYAEQPAPVAAVMPERPH